jgi:hypothetical protein
VSPKFEVSNFFYRSPEFGYCIYCGGTKDLSDEHAIPFALYGRIELLKASCAECRKATHEFETHCIDQLFGATRYRIGIPPRPGRKRRSTHNVHIERMNGKRETIAVPTDDFPRGISMPVFQPPTMLRGLYPAHESAGNIWTSMQRGDLEAFEAKYGVVKAVHRSIKLSFFQRMLAKIGHCIAIANMDKDEFAEFELLLPPLIRFGDGDAEALVGSIDLQMSASTNQMHQVEVFTVDQHIGSERRELLVTTFRLMAFLRGPQHLVVVGTRPLARDDLGVLEGAVTEIFVVE